jgi:ParB-like chromosome segregation protein Spo0J
MIELRTTPEYLERLAADHISEGRNGTGSDLKAAALDLKNLREYAETLERNIQNMSAEMQTVVEQRQQFADVLFDLMRDRIGKYIDRTLADREEDTDYVLEDKIRQTVSDMIRDGEITAEVDCSNIELELTLNA